MKNNFVKKWMDRITKPQTHVDKKQKLQYIRGQKHKSQESYMEYTYSTSYKDIDILCEYVLEDNSGDGEQFCPPDIYIISISVEGTEYFLDGLLSEDDVSYLEREIEKSLKQGKDDAILDYKISAKEEYFDGY